MSSRDGGRQAGDRRATDACDERGRASAREVVAIGLELDARQSTRRSIVPLAARCHASRLAGSATICSSTVEDCLARTDGGLRDYVLGREAISTSHRFTDRGDRRVASSTGAGRAARRARAGRRARGGAELRAGRALTGDTARLRERLTGVRGLVRAARAEVADEPLATATPASPAALWSGAEAVSVCARAPSARR